MAITGWSSLPFITSVVCYAPKDQDIPLGFCLMLRLSCAARTVGAAYPVERDLRSVGTRVYQHQPAACCPTNRGVGNLEGGSHEI